MPTYLGKRKKNAPRATSRSTKAVAKRSRTRRVGRPPVGLYPSTYKFKRSITEVIELNTTTVPPDGWAVTDNALTAQLVFSLEQLTDSSDFTNLFRKYKITGVRTEFFFTNNSAKSDGYSTGTQRVPQIMMYTNVNQTGRVNGTLTEQYFLNSQTAQRATVIQPNHKPPVLFHNVKQLNRVYNGIAAAVGNNDYSLSTPRYVSTQDKTVQHYGFEIRLQSVRGGPIPSATQEQPIGVKLIHTFYISCQGVE